MVKEIKFKALMVRDKTHYKVIVEAKKRGKTVDEYINSLITWAKGDKRQY